MSNRHDEDQENVVVDLVDDSVVASAHPQRPITTDQPGCPAGSRLLGQQLDGALHSSSRGGVELSQLPHRGGSELDPVRHVRPRSALTRSHGMAVSPPAISSRAALAAWRSARSSAASRSRLRSSASMTAAQRDELEHQIHCQCGCNLDVYTCRTTDFACSVSPAMHSDVMGLVAGGHSAEEILTAFKSVYGEKVLMAPVKAGFNLIGYTVPFIALGTGAVVLAALMRRWKRTPVVTTLPASHIEATEGELAALDAAVKQDR